MASPNSNAEQSYTPEQKERAVATLRRYRSWKQRNRSAYAISLSRAVGQAKSGGRVSGDELVQFVRNHDVVDIDGKPAKVNNDFAPLLVRDIARKCPEVRGHIEGRTTIYDELGFSVKGGE